MQPLELIRSNEPVFKELKLESADRATLIAAMAKHPILIQRPIVVNGKKARLGRPPEAVLGIL
jgi:arsenate reductase